MKKSSTIAAVFLIGFGILTVTAEAQTLNAVQQTTGAITSLSTIVNTFTSSLVKSLGTLAMAAAMVAFLYGIVEYVWGVRQADPKVIKDGNSFMKWGLLALFVMFSVYGIIKYGQNIIFGTMDLTKITIPEINFIPGSNTAPAPKTDPLSPATFLCPDKITYAPNINGCPKYYCPGSNTIYYTIEAKDAACGKNSQE